MKILNVHTRKIEGPKNKVDELIQTLASREDKVWPREQWPAMRLDHGLKVGSKGGHGIIGYYIKEYVEGERIVFEFTKPKGFTGSHYFEMEELNQNRCLLKHTIKMEAKGKATLAWVLFIRPLHDALIEDLFDKVDNQTTESKKRTEWSLWVKFLRKLLFRFRSNKKVKKMKPVNS